MVIVADEPRADPIQITLTEPGEDRELKAIAYINSILNVMNYEQRRRILNYLCERHPLIEHIEMVPERR